MSRFKGPRRPLTPELDEAFANIGIATNRHQQELQQRSRWEGSAGGPATTIDRTAYKLARRAETSRAAWQRAAPWATTERCLADARAYHRFVEEQAALEPTIAWQPPTGDTELVLAMHEFDKLTTRLVDEFSMLERIAAAQAEAREVYDCYFASLHWMVRELPAIVAEYQRRGGSAEYPTAHVRFGVHAVKELLALLRHGDAAVPVH